MLRVSEGVLYGLGRPRFIVIAGLVATVVDIGLAFLLIPKLDAVGAAIANGAAILVAGVPCLVLAVRLHRPVLASGGAAACARSLLSPAGRAGRVRRLAAARVDRRCRRRRGRGRRRSRCSCGRWPPRTPSGWRVRSVTTGARGVAATVRHAARVAT